MGESFYDERCVDIEFEGREGGALRFGSVERVVTERMRGAVEVGEGSGGMNPRFERESVGAHMLDRALKKALHGEGRLDLDSRSSSAEIDLGPSGHRLNKGKEKWRTD